MFVWWILNGVWVIKEARVITPSALGRFMLRHVAVVILVWITMAHYAQLDELEKLSYNGLGPYGIVARPIVPRIAGAPEFDPDRLRPLITSNRDSDHDLAFGVLHERNQIDDLAQLLDVVSVYPKLEASLERDYTSVTLLSDIGAYDHHLRYWLDDLGRPKGVVTPAALRAWLDQQLAERANDATHVENDE